MPRGLPFKTIPSLGTGATGSKAIAFTAVTLAVSLVTSFASFFVGQAILSGKHINVTLTVVAPRRQGIKYDVEHDGNRLLIPHRGDTRLLGMGAFENFLVVYFRRDGLTGAAGHHRRVGARSR